MTDAQFQDWIARLEASRGVGPDGDRGLCEQTGRPFDTVTLNHSGTSFIKTEGLPADTFPTPEEARSAFAQALLRYLALYQGKIHWRYRPVLHQGKLYPRTTFDPLPEPNPDAFCVLARLSIG